MQAKNTIFYHFQSIGKEKMMTFCQKLIKNGYFCDGLQEYLVFQLTPITPTIFRT